MISLAAGLLILLQLRLRLLLRGGSSGRGGPSSRRTSMLVRVIVLAALALWLSFTVSGLLSRVVSGPLGRLLLAPLLTWLSSWGTLLLFLLAMPTVLGALTYKSDLKLLLLTPLSPRLILAEKFCSVLGGFRLPLLVMGLLILLGVGQALDLGLGYDLAALAALLLLPIA